MLEIQVTDIILKLVGGNDAFLGTAFETMKNLPLASMLRNVEVRDDANDIWDYSNTTLFDYIARDGLAVLQTQHKFGLSYYRNSDGHDILQFFGLQRVRPGGIFSGGSMWTNYGIGFKLG